jgi:hypothetical protein
MKKIIIPLLLVTCLRSTSQENYEIQVYASPTMTKGMTIFELHNNYTVNGEKQIIEGVRPSWHSFHETIEITHGIAENFELGFYLFMNYSSPYGFQLVGTHIRPRITAPLAWTLPVGLSLSAEIGYQRKTYSPETWNVELRPIIDKTVGKLYLSFNPTLGFTVKGVAKQNYPAFAPNIKASYAFTPVMSLGTEYYGDLGALNNFENGPDQSHALFLVADLFVDPKWEINFGPGWGLTNASEKLVVKILVGRRIQWKK